MKLTSCSAAALLLLLPFTGNAQCGIIVVGEFDQTIVPGNAHTPFPTNTGSNNRRGFRAQYLYRAAELTAAGLCPGFITKLSFYALETDGAPDCFPTVNCPDIRVDLRMTNTYLNDFGADTVFGNWDTIAQASVNVNANSTLPFRVIEGYIDFPLLGDGFEWTGGNLLIDVSWQRAAAIGNSPAVEVEEGLPYYATKSVQMTSSVNANHGNTFSDVDPPLGSDAFWTNTRPLTRFWTDLNTGFTPGASATASALRYDAGSALCTVRLPAETGIDRVLLLDGLGRTVGTAAVNGGSQVELPMGHLAPGVYSVAAGGGRGMSLIGKVMKP